MGFECIINEAHHYKGSSIDYTMSGNDLIK
jgi:hypothetical protein